MTDLIRSDEGQLLLEKMRLEHGIADSDRSGALPQGRRQRDRETERQRDRKRQREIEGDRGRQRRRYRHTQRQRQSQGQRQRQGQGQRNSLRIHLEVLNKDREGDGDSHLLILLHRNMLPFGLFGIRFKFIKDKEKFDEIANKVIQSNQQCFV